MTDCHGLSEDEAKMLLELELLAVSATPPRGDEAPHRPSPKSSKARCGGQSQTRGNLGLRMRAVKEEEEEEESSRRKDPGEPLGRPAAVCLCFVAATSVQHHQVVPGQDLLAVGVSCLKTCGEGGALFEDSQDNLLDLHAWEDNEPQEIFPRELASASFAFNVARPEFRKLFPEFCEKVEKVATNDVPAPEPVIVEPPKTSSSSLSKALLTFAIVDKHAKATAQPKIRILVRPAAEVTELEHEVHMQKEAPEDPWCTGPDPWSMGRERGAQGPIVSIGGIN
eukprot:g26803.t1